jgi:putative FmdB family regulatory protein
LLPPYGKIAYMPIYEYICAPCELEFEELAGLNELPPKCPLCTQEVERKISLTSFRLKGGGWYADAYTGKSNKTPVDASKERNDE